VVRAARRRVAFWRPAEQVLPRRDGTWMLEGSLDPLFLDFDLVVY
jgi:hypothetical protein